MSSDLIELGNSLTQKSQEIVISIIVCTTMQTHSKSSTSSASSGNPSTTCPPTAPSTQSQKKKRKEKTQWSPEEEDKLIEFLSQLENNMNDNNAFKDTAFANAVVELKPLHLKGAIKEASLCKTRWNMVCISFVRLLPVS